MRSIVLVDATICLLWHVIAWDSAVAQTCVKEYVQPYNCSILPDYYWRDYDGTIPNDAIVGGSDEGKIIYVGQVLDREWILPANIYPCQKEALTNGYRTGFRSKNSVKILCSQYKDRFRWIATSLTEMHLLADFTLVVGGTEAGALLNIGRANFEQRVITGKIFPSESPYRGLSIATRDGKEKTLHSFEILAFERHAPSHCGENCDCGVFKK